MAPRDPKSPPPIPAQAAPDPNAQLMAQLLQQNQQMLQMFGQMQAQVAGLAQRPQVQPERRPEPVDPVMQAIDQVFPQDDADSGPMRTMFLAMRQDAVAERQERQRMEGELKRLQATYHGTSITNQTDAAIASAAAKHGIDPASLGSFRGQIAATIYTARMNGVDATIESLADRAMAGVKEVVSHAVAVEAKKQPQRQTPFAVTGGRLPGVARPDRDAETVEDMHADFDSEMAALTRLAASGADVDYQAMFAAAGDEPADDQVH